MSSTESRIRRALGLSDSGRVRLFRNRQKSPGDTAGWYYRPAGAPRAAGSWLFLGKFSDEVVCRGKKYCEACSRGPLAFDEPQTTIFQYPSEDLEGDGVQIALGSNSSVESSGRSNVQPGEEAAPQAGETLGGLSVVAVPQEEYAVLSKRQVAALHTKVDGRPLFVLANFSLQGTIIETSAVDELTSKLKSLGTHPQVWAAAAAPDELKPLLRAFSASPPPRGAYEVVPSALQPQNLSPPLALTSYIPDDVISSDEYNRRRALGLIARDPIAAGAWPVGSWRVSDREGHRGREIAQLRLLDPGSVRVASRPTDEEVTAWIEFLSAEPEVMPRPIEVTISLGEQTAIFGEAVLAACRKLGRPVPAWVLDSVRVDELKVATGLTLALVNPSLASSDEVKASAVNSRLRWFTPSPAPASGAKAERLALKQRVLVRLQEGGVRPGRISRLLSATSYNKPNGYWVTLEPAAGERSTKRVAAGPEDVQPLAEIEQADTRDADAGGLASWLEKLDAIQSSTPVSPERRADHFRAFPFELVTEATGAELERALDVADKYRIPARGRYAGQASDNIVNAIRAEIERRRADVVATRTGRPVDPQHPWRPTYEWVSLKNAGGRDSGIYKLYKGDLVLTVAGSSAGNYFSLQAERDYSGEIQRGTDFYPLPREYTTKYIDVTSELKRHGRRSVSLNNYKRALWAFALDIESGKVRKPSLSSISLQGIADALVHIYRDLVGIRATALTIFDNGGSEYASLEQIGAAIRDRTGELSGAAGLGLRFFDTKQTGEPPFLTFDDASQVEQENAQSGLIAKLAVWLTPRDFLAQRLRVARLVKSHLAEAEMAEAWARSLGNSLGRGMLGRWIAAAAGEAAVLPSSQEPTARAARPDVAAEGAEGQERADAAVVAGGAEGADVAEGAEGADVAEGVDVAEGAEVTDGAEGVRQGENASATGVPQSTLSSDDPIWTLTLDQFRRDPRATKVKASGILGLKPEEIDGERLRNFGLDEVRILATLVGSPRSGNRNEVTSRLIETLAARQRLSDATVASLTALPQGELRALLKSLRLYLGGNKQTNATTLINWRNNLRAMGRAYVAQANWLNAIQLAARQGYQIPEAVRADLRDRGLSWVLGDDVQEAAEDLRLIDAEGADVAEGAEGAEVAEGAEGADVAEGAEPREVAEADALGGTVSDAAELTSEAGSRPYDPAALRAAADAHQRRLAGPLWATGEIYREAERAERAEEAEARELEANEASPFELQEGEQSKEEEQAEAPAGERRDEPPETDAQTIARHGLAIQASQTKPTRPGKKPRPIFVAVGNTAPYREVLRTLGGKQFRGQVTFFDDPSAALANHLRRFGRPSVEERIESRIARSAARAERLEDRAARTKAAADQALARARSVSDLIPFGQPILIGHHSEGRHRGDLRRIENATRKGYELQDKADYLASASAAAAGTVDTYENVTIGFAVNRLKEQRAELARVERELGSSRLTEDSDRKSNLEIRREDAKKAISYWEAKVAELGGVQYSNQNVAKGDLVEYLGSFYPVVRVNRESVTIGNWLGVPTLTGTAPYHKITGLIKPAAPAKPGASELEKADYLIVESLESLRRVAPLGPNFGDTKRPADELQELLAAKPTFPSKAWLLGLEKLSEKLEQNNELREGLSRAQVQGAVKKLDEAQAAYSRARKQDRAAAAAADGDGAPPGGLPPAAGSVLETAKQAGSEVLEGVKDLINKSPAGDILAAASAAGASAIARARGLVEDAAENVREAAAGAADAASAVYGALSPPSSPEDRGRPPSGDGRTADAAKSKAATWRKAAERNLAAARDYFSRGVSGGSPTAKRLGQAESYRLRGELADLIGRVQNGVADAIEANCQPEDIARIDKACLPPELSTLDGPQVAAAIITNKEYYPPSVNLSDYRTALLYTENTRDLAKFLPLVRSLRFRCPADDRCLVEDKDELTQVVEWLKALQGRSEGGRPLDGVGYLENHKSNLALLRAGITDRESYLRVRDSLLKISQAKSRDDQGKAQEIAIKQAAAALKGIPGFYPTHPELADIVVERLQLIPGERVLESSAGAGHIAEAVRRAGAEPDVIERNDDLRAILELKGFQVVGRDFLNFTPQQPYDAVAQNPPFENSADIDHIRHAFEVVRPGGRVSSIASESTFVGESKKQKDFRNWLNELGAKIEVLPADSFLKLKPSTPFRARLISFRKPSKADAAEFPPLQDLLPSIEAEVVTLLNDREPISLLISVDGRAPVEYRLSPLDSGLYAISRGTEPTLTRAPGELAEIISALGEVIGTRGGRPLVVRAELASDPGALAPSVATQSAEGVQSTSVAAWKNIAPDTAGVFRASRGPAVLTITRGQEPAGLRASVALDGESYDLPYDYKLKYGVGGGAPAARLEAAERALWEFAGALLAARQDQAAPAGSESVDPELDFIAALREASNV